MCEDCQKLREKFSTVRTLYILCAVCHLGKKREYYPTSEELADKRREVEAELESVLDPVTKDQPLPDNIKSV